MQHKTNHDNALTAGGAKKTVSLVAVLTMSLSLIAMPSRAEEAAPRGTTVRGSRADSEKTDTRMVIVQKEGELRIELQQIWEKWDTGEESPYSSATQSDPASLGRFVRDLQACRETPDLPDCERVNVSGTEEVEQVLRSPELYGMYVGMLAGAFTAGFCAVRPEDCVDPFLP